MHRSAECTARGVVPSRRSEVSAWIRGAAEAHVPGAGVSEVWVLAATRFRFSRRRGVKDPTRHGGSCLGQLAVSQEGQLKSFA